MIAIFFQVLVLCANRLYQAEGNVTCSVEDPVEGLSLVAEPSVVEVNQTTKVSASIELGTNVAYQFHTGEESEYCNLRCDRRIENLRSGSSIKFLKKAGVRKKRGEFGFIATLVSYIKIMNTAEGFL